MKSIFIASHVIICLEDFKEKNENRSEENTTTNRCLDCSRESWKTKRFTNIGMNTEMSWNPSKDLDVAKIIANKNQQVVNNNNQSPNNDNNNNNNNNNNKEKPSFTSKPIAPQHSPSVVPSARNGVAFIKSEYPQHTASKQSLRANGKHHEEQRPVTSPTYNIEMYAAHHASAGSQARYPGLEAPGHYDRFMQPSHHHGWMLDRASSRYEQTRHGGLSPTSRRSPSSSSNRRSRSPISPRAGDFLAHPHYHAAAAAAFHEKYRPVILPATHYVHGAGRRREARNPQVPAVEMNGHHDEKMMVLLEPTAPSYIKKEKSAQNQLRDFNPSVEKVSRNTNSTSGNNSLQQPGDEPPVFVLPNDYDVISGIDPRIASMQERRSPVPTTTQNKDEEIEDQKIPKEEGKDLKDEFQNSPGESVGSSNGNTNGAPDSPPNNNVNINSSQKLYCKICSGVFPTKSLLYKHLRGHTSDEKPFKCNECGQGFTLSSNLRQHRIIHRGYKPFQCEFCGKKFMRSNVYKQHRRIHTGEEMHKCGLCPSEFLQKYALLKHMKKNHDIDAVDN